MNGHRTTPAALHPTPPFDFAQTLQALRQFETLEGETRVDDHGLTRAARVAGATVAWRVEAAGTAARPALAYTLHSREPLPEAVRAAAADRLAFWLSLDDDLEPFYALARDDPPFWPVVDQLYGYHPVKFLTPFECAVWGVLSRRNLFTIARRMKRGLVEAFGDTLEVDGARFPVFPDAEAVAAAGPEAVIAAIRHKTKGAAVHNAAAAWLNADEAWLRTAPYDEARAWLLGVKGIGPWTAGFVLLRGLGRTEGLPPSDKWIAAAAEERYGPVPLEALAQRYGPYKGYWAHYLRMAG